MPYKNKEEEIKRSHNYYIKHKEVTRARHKAYNQSPEGIKNRILCSWKKRGVISDDYDALYDKYINTNECELCKISITEGQGLIGKKHLDHDHETGEFRNILCGKCNMIVLRKK